MVKTRAKSQTTRMPISYSGRWRRQENEENEELRRRTEALSDLVEDPNSSVLGDPAPVAVLRAPTTEPGPSRPTRQVFKCPVAGCPITRMTEAAISVHFENAHE